jgi:uncharacterized protein YdaU (DUF1376 family)
MSAGATSRLPYLPWFYSDFFTSVTGWPLNAQGAYLRLLAMQWDRGTLPVDPDDLRALAGARAAEWRGIWSRLEPKFPLNGAGRSNPRLERERDKATSLSERRRDGARKTNAQRWGAE